MRIATLRDVPDDKYRQLAVFASLGREPDQVMDNLLCMYGICAPPTTWMHLARDFMFQFGVGEDFEASWNLCRVSSGRGRYVEYPGHVALSHSMSLASLAGCLCYADYFNEEKRAANS